MTRLLSGTRVIDENFEIVSRPRASYPVAHDSIRADCLSVVVRAAVLERVRFAQTNPLVGTWKLVAADALKPDGSRVEDYGPSPRGLAVFTADGHYMV